MSNAENNSWYIPDNGDEVLHEEMVLPSKDHGEPITKERGYAKVAILNISGLTAVKSHASKAT